MLTLRPYQAEAKQAVLTAWDEGQRKTLLVLPTGCHARGGKLLMADGTEKSVEDINLGDHLIGADGNVRTVLHITNGVGKLYRVIPIKGEPFTVTGDHKLTLQRTNTSGNPRYPSQYKGGEIIDVTVDEWLSWTRNQKHLYKLVRSGVIVRFPDVADTELPVDPYFLGIILGDGGLTHSISVTTMDPKVLEELEKQAARYDMHLRAEDAGLAKTYYFVLNHRRRCESKGTQLRQDLMSAGIYGKKSGEKFVPIRYKTADIGVRLQVLAGLMDTDGSLSKNGYDFISKSEQLARDTAFLARSCGLAAYVKECQKGCGDFVGTYFRVYISGDCSIIPCQVAHKKADRRRQKKDVLRTGFTVEDAGTGEYFGFTVDGDNRYLLDDFTITHNCGKTIVFASVAGNEVDKGHRVLIMAHRGELLEQAQGKLKEAIGLDSVLEKAGETALGKDAPVTVGSVQSLSQPSRLERFPENYYQDIIVDEAHHCLSGSYQRVLSHFPKANVLGVTATPDRGDMKSLGTYFDSKAYEYSMPQAIRDGYLVPIKSQMIPLELDISQVGMSNGDYSVGETGNALEPYLEKIADEMLHYCKGRKTVVFLPLVKIAQEFTEVLKSKGFHAAEVNGNSDDRKQVLEDFENGRYDVLCNAMLLTEGWDCPSVDCVIVLRPTKIRSLYQQMVGRGTRLSPGKKDLLLLDFLWLTERHDLCRPSSLVSKDANIAARMDQMARENPEGVDIIESEEQAERDVLKEREESLAKQLAEMRAKKRKLVDPLQYALSIAAEDLTTYEPTFTWEMAPPSSGQLAFLEKRGILPNEVACTGMASLLIDRLIRRQNEGLSTPKQIRCLERYGFQHVGTWSFSRASDMISYIAGNRWALPKGMNPATYVPS